MTKLVFCADDFTGASDTLATLARAGLSARLYLNAPVMSEHKDEVGHGSSSLDAFGVATSLRAMGVEDGVATIGELADQLAKAKCGIYHFKICSTFDSGPQTGNIAAVADRYAQSVGATWKAIIGGQPSLRRFCFMGNLFAGVGAGQIHRIDRHPVMAHHPVTPMNEADLPRHLAGQGWPNVGLIDFTIIRQGRVALIAEIKRRIANGETETLFDATDENDLLTIGEALQDIAKSTTILCVGASSVAQALFPSFTPASDGVAKASRRAGPVFAFAGSRSPLTAEQVVSAQNYVKYRVSPSDLLDPVALKQLQTECLDVLHSGKNLLVSLSDDRNHTIVSHDLAQASACFIAEISRSVALGFLLIAGGDTSSLAVQALGIDSLSYVADFDAGAPVIRAHASNGSLDGLPMLLKGGQMGKPALFDNITNLPATAK
ncbi:MULTISPECIES: four-carbon acid sugar kinase family protein [Thalassospira]|uniref:Four-carbon acid sugar kinase family protein n=1 Tax=Thalassospira aquimaris TaxID=3037796 RepID=A0ABT6G7R8_9PROT|nr:MULTISPECIES: four-carbon acid sugar kinase family protein [Thalassospira]MDG4718102.1 four-carbon acid sugar kinase family protein [Thalassospira sp. FZY0004]